MSRLLAAAALAATLAFAAPARAEGKPIQLALFPPVQIVPGNQSIEGLQLGFVNNTGTIHGLQLGLVDIIKQGGWLPVMVIANGNFN